MGKTKQIDIDDFGAVGTAKFKGTLYGPEEDLREEQKPFRMMNYEEYLKYEEKVDKSEGFEVDDCPGNMAGRIVLLYEGGSSWEDAKIIALNAGRKQGEAMGIIIEFERLLKANIQCVAGSIYYLTFVATDNNKSEKTYRAKVWTRPTWECKIVRFLNGAHGKKDITLAKTDTMGLRKRKRHTLREEDYISFSLVSRFGKPVKEPTFTTISPSKEQVWKDCCDLLAKELKKQNTEWTDAQASKTASSKWIVFNYRERKPYFDEAKKMFQRQYPQYFPNIE